MTARPIVAAGTLLILQAVILAPTLGWPSRVAAIWVAVGAGAVTLLLEHRTVWVAGLAVAIVGFVWWSARQNRDARAGVFAATGIVLLLLPIAIWGFARTGPLVGSVKETTSSDSTFVWRTTGWEKLISSHDSPAQLATGSPSGGDWSRVINGTVVDVSPHDGFVDAYLRFGLPGVLIFCWLGLLLWFRRRRSVAAAAGITTQAVGLLLLTQLAFNVTYSLDAVQGVIAGILVSGLAVTSPARTPLALRSALPAPEFGHAIR